MNFKAALLVVFLLIGCNNDQQWAKTHEAFRFTAPSSRPATITTSEFKNGQLRIGGNCYSEGQILVIWPDTEGDSRIIGSTKCSNGTYRLLTSKFGRPPCGVVVDYDGRKVVSAQVEGAEIYCP